MDGLPDRIDSVLHGLAGIFSTGLDTVEALDPVVRTLAAGLATMLETFVVTGLFTPGDTVVVVASAAVGTPAEGVLLVLALTAGSLLGELGGYGLGRWSARGRGARLLRRAEGRPQSTAQRLLLARGGPAVLGSRFLPVLRTVMPFVVGLSGFPLRRFLAWSVPAAVAWSAVSVTVYSVAAAPLRDGSGSAVVSAALVLVGVLLLAGASAVQLVLERRYDGPEQVAGPAPVPDLGDAPR